jgi:spore maturation protein SpmA
MVLNIIWVSFVLVAFVVALYKLFFLKDLEVFNEVVSSTFGMSKTAFEISIGLTGVLTLWLGIMKVGEAGGAIQILSKLIGPFFRKLFPELPKDHPVFGTMVMNFAANMLGLDNAATPVGLKAMKELQELNPKKDTASNSQIMFLVLNTSGLTLIPISIMVYRAQMGAANPSDVFLPILLTTFFSTLAGLLAVSLFQKIKLYQPIIMAYLLGLCTLVAGIFFVFFSLPKEQVQVVSELVANVLLFGVISGFVGLAAIKKVNVYDVFIEGAKEGFSIAIKIIPFLVAILVAIGVFRASGAMGVLLDGFRYAFNLLNINQDIVEALPTAMMKPLSGSGARGMMVDAMTTHGADSFVGRLVSTFQGATDTTFFIIAVYFGSVGIKNTRHAISAGLIADGVGIVAAIVIGSFFFL